MKKLPFFLANCGGSYSSNRGSLHSPGWPNSYPENIDCIWEIRVPERNFIVLKVENFTVEWEENCEYDYLQIL